MKMPEPPQRYKFLCRDNFSGLLVEYKPCCLAEVMGNIYPKIAYSFDRQYLSL